MSVDKDELAELTKKRAVFKRKITIILKDVSSVTDKISLSSIEEEVRKHLTSVENIDSQIADLYLVHETGDEFSTVLEKELLTQSNYQLKIKTD